jgi:hypothetical protein
MPKANRCSLDETFRPTELTHESLSSAAHLIVTKTDALRCDAQSGS